VNRRAATIHVSLVHDLMAISVQENPSVAEDRPQISHRGLRPQPTGKPNPEKRGRTITDSTDSTDEEKKGTWVEARRHEARNDRFFS
jgi:hypothetical protein